MASYPNDQCSFNSKFLTGQIKGPRCPEKREAGSQYCPVHRAQAMARLGQKRDR